MEVKSYLTFLEVTGSVLLKKIIVLLEKDSSCNAIKIPPLEFSFKGKGIRVKVNPPERATAQWIDKGSYKVEHVLKYIESLPTISIYFTPEKRVFILDDYLAHLVSEVEEAFFKMDTFDYYLRRYHWRHAGE